MRHHLIAALSCCAALHAQSFVNYECGATAPVRVSGDGAVAPHS